MVVGLVVGQLRETGLKEVANPPYAQPERDQGVGTEQSVYLFDGCSHTAAKVAKFIGFAPPGLQREVHADSFCEKSPHEGGRGIFFPRRPPSAVLFTICSLIGAPNDCRHGNNLYICSGQGSPPAAAGTGSKGNSCAESGAIPVAVSSRLRSAHSQSHCPPGREGVRKGRARRPALTELRHPPSGYRAVPGNLDIYTEQFRGKDHGCPGGRHAGGDAASVSA